MRLNFPSFPELLHSSTRPSSLRKQSFPIMASSDCSSQVSDSEEVIECSSEEDMGWYDEVRVNVMGEVEDGSSPLVFHNGEMCCVNVEVAVNALMLAVGMNLKVLWGMVMI